MADENNKKTEKISSESITKIILAIIGVAGTIATAYFGFLSIKTQVEKPISASQTAELAISTSEATDTTTSQAELESNAADSLEASTINPEDTQTESISESSEIIRITYNPDSMINSCTTRILPKNLHSELNFSSVESSDKINDAIYSDEYVYWKLAPNVAGLDYYNVRAEYEFDISALGSNDEWLKIEKDFGLSVISSPSNSDLIVISIGMCGGVGEERIATKEVELNSTYKTVTTNIEFAGADFYTLQPGEIEAFIVPFVCKEPGEYQLTLELNFSYKGESYKTLFSSFPPIVCPSIATFWSWGRNYTEDYIWEDGEYIIAGN